MNVLTWQKSISYVNKSHFQIQFLYKILRNYLTFLQSFSKNFLKNVIFSWKTFWSSFSLKFQKNQGWNFKFCTLTLPLTNIDLWDFLILSINVLGKIPNNIKRLRYIWPWSSMPVMGNSSLLFSCSHLQLAIFRQQPVMLENSWLFVKITGK